MMDIDIPFTGFVLQNGLNVIVHEDRSLPLVSVNLWYHVGSKNERPGRTGFAHLFEHVMFEGSAHVEGGAFDHLLESAGGVNNGSTTTDRTNYWENVPSNALELALWLEADRMGFLLDAMTQEKLDVQRDVVRNERRQSYENRPYGLAFETVLAALYPPDHPYHWPVIGSMEDLAAATLEDVREFFRTYYAPNNASLAVAGDVDAREARELVERWFGDIPPGPPAPPVLVPEGGLETDGRLVLEDQVSLPRVYLAWRAPRQFTREDAVLELLASVLAEGKGSRLYRRLVYGERVAQDVSAFQHGGEVDGSFFIIVTARPGVGLQELERAVREEAARVASWDEELERLLVEARRDRSSEVEVPLPSSLSATALARLRDDPDAVREELETLRQLQEQYGSRATSRFVLSMTHRPDDVRRVLELARAARVEQLDVVPLFETVDDLQRSSEIMRGLYEDEAYRRHLAGRGG
ncbi:MAG: phosphoenolpyruvate carboxylase, partial [Gemmatimonadetes bacterium]|nr:phosphoenolpyruvate carboxylase [Gemmatimonadota bacterium]